MLNEPELVWAVCFKGHIHTDAKGKMAVFITRADAKAWVSKYGMPGCMIIKVMIGDGWIK